MLIRAFAGEVLSQIPLEDLRRADRRASSASACREEGR